MVVASYKPYHPQRLPKAVSGFALFTAISVHSVAVPLLAATKLRRDALPSTGCPAAMCTHAVVWTCRYYQNPPHQEFYRYFGPKTAKKRDL